MRSHVHSIMSMFPGDIGQSFYIKPFKCSNFTIRNDKLTMGQDYSMMLMIENVSKEVICIEKGEKIGLVSEKKENFLALIGSETLPSENETSNLSTSHKVSNLPADPHTKENTEQDVSSEKKIPQSDSKLPNNTDPMWQMPREPSTEGKPNSTAANKLPFLSSPTEAQSSLQLNKSTPKSFIKQKISYSEWKERRKKLLEQEVAPVNTQSSPNNSRASKETVCNNAMLERNNKLEDSVDTLELHSGHSG